MTERDRPGPVAPDVDLATRRRWFVVAIAVVLGILPLFPPGVGDESDAEAFSTSRAMGHIEWIAAAPHPIGSQENVRVRERIADELAAADVVAEFQRVRAADWFDPAGATIDVVNVVARIPGTAPTGAVAIVGHYDTVPDTPGANDNASAVAVMLETARIVAAGDRLRNDVIFVFTDGEEPAPRFGATAFVDEHRWSDDIEFVINLEAIGSGGPSTLLQISGPPGWVTRQYLDAVPHPMAYSFVTELTALVGGSKTDFERFRDEGIPGIEMVYLRGSPIYHTMDDTPDRVGTRSLHQHGANTLALVRELGETDFAEPRGDSAPVLVTLGRGHVVQYPSWLAIVLVAATAVAMAAVFRHLSQVRHAVVDASIVFGRSLGLAIVASVIWMLLAAWRSTMGVAEGYLYLFGLGALVVAASTAIDRSRERRPSPPGVATLWWALALVALLGGPGTNAIFVWATFCAALALVLDRHGAGRGVVEVVELLAVASAVVLTIPAIDLLFQFAQPRPGNPDSQITWTIAAPLLLIALVAELVRSVGRSPVGVHHDEPAIDLSDDCVPVDAL